MSYKLLFCAILICGVIAIRHHYFTCKIIRFNEYLQKFNKTYSATEMLIRMKNYEESLKEIEKLNSKTHGTGAVHGLTRFSDWSKEEFNKLLLQGTACTNTVIKCPWAFWRMSIRVNRAYNDAPERFDWRDYDGVIGPVENQKLCNGCWAFGIVGVMEAMSAINGLGRERLSVQELLDCSTVNKGCNGGNIDSAMSFLCITHFKLTTADRYPLILVQEKCKSHPTEGRGIKSYASYCHVQDKFIVEYIANQGPLMIVINPSTLMNYNSGIIIRNCHSDSLGMVHVVLVVGYDSTTDADTGEEIKYFIIKNTWGDDWGEGGYIRIAWGRNQNLCGLNDHVAFLNTV